MTGTKYLSELVDCSALQKGKLNVIKAPTGSGKTYFALQHIPFSPFFDYRFHYFARTPLLRRSQQIVERFRSTEYENWAISIHRKRPK